MLFSAMQLIFAQDFEIKSIRESQTDLSACTNARNDLNGTPCGLIKISATLSNITFGGSIIGTVTRDGSEYWVYLPAGTKNLQLKHPNFKNTIISFPNFGIERIESKRTYYMDVQVDGNVGYNIGHLRGDVAARISKYNEQNHNKKKQIKNYIDAFFPVNGIILGKSTFEDARNIGYNVNESGSYLDFDTNGISWSNNFNEDSKAITYMQIFDIPSEWKLRYGFDFALSYNEWWSLFESLGFRMDIEVSPRVKQYDNKDQLYAKIQATAPNGLFRFELTFDNGQDGCGLDSPNTLYFGGFVLKSVSNEKNSHLMDRIKATNKKVKKKDSVAQTMGGLFPIDGLIIGHSTWYDAYNTVHLLDIGEDYTTCKSLGLTFWDRGNKGYFNEIAYTEGLNNFPPLWEEFGFQQGNSYDTWIKVLKGQGWTITKNDIDNNYCGFKATIVAISPNAKLRIKMNFRSLTEGSSISTPGTLEDFKMVTIE